jgi:signal transduction histidine kinase
MVQMSIRDDGRGFDPSSVPAGHLGIRIMQERAAGVGAHVSIESVEGHGTCVTITRPLT